MLRRKPALPAARTLPWPLRAVDSARHALEIDRRGRLVMRIKHAALPGLEPEDLCWWFRHIGGEVLIGSVPMSRYHAWHPADHIHWALARPGPAGGAEAGARFHIVEAFGRDPAHLVDVVEQVTRLDDTGITLEKRVLRLTASRLSHDFSAGSEGAGYRSELVVGFDLPLLGRFVNAVIRRLVFSPAMGRAWIRHNIEEVGLLEHLIPLVRSQDAARASPPAAAQAACHRTVEGPAAN